MNTQLQDRLIAPYPGGPRFDEIHAGALFRRLLLFENYILQSIRFSEFVPLARRVGPSILIKLLDSGALKIQLDPNQIAQVGQTQPLRNGKPVLSPGSASFSVLLVEGGLYESYIHRCIADLDRQLYGHVSRSDRTKLECALIGAMVQRTETPSVFSKTEALLDMLKELRAGTPLLKRSLMLRLREIKGIEVSEAELDFRTIPLNEEDFRLESNLVAFGLTASEAHSLSVGACLGVGTLSSRIEEMKRYNALSGCLDHELALFGEKFDLLSESLVSSSRKEKLTLPLHKYEGTLGRVLRLCKLPSFDLKEPDKTFDVERFLEVRSSPEAVEFRTWLRRAHEAKDEEIEDQVQKLRVRLRTFLDTGTGRMLRFAVNSVAAICADASIPLSGTAVGALDTFVIEKLLRVSGPTLFLSRHYPSVFRDADAEKVGAADQRAS